MKPRILLMEDEDTLRHVLSMNLELEGYQVREAGNGREALEVFNEEHFDLVMLDVMVPEIDGLSVCDHIRVRNDKVPVLFLSALNMSNDKVKGLKRGADDYLTKPFNLEELLLRIDRLVRKRLRNSELPETHKPGEFRFGENRVNFESYEAEGPQGKFLMTRREADLMRFFCENPNEVLSRDRILHAVWGYSVYPNTRSIDNFVLYLRQRFEPNLKQPRFIRSVRGIGYRFTPTGH